MAQTTWDQDANVTFQNVTASGTLTLAGKLLTPPALAGTLATLLNAETLKGKTLSTLNGGVGASTAAAGTTVSDAGALPAGTAIIYPTTAADGTKGVVIHTSDKVDGRVLLIGNGVSTAILKVYGPSGATINGAAADAAFSSASGKGVIIACLSSASNTWLAW